MKFGKEFAAQMVPEWQEAYMDYNFLKTLLKEIHRFKERNKTTLSISASLKRNMTLRRAFSGLTHRNPSPRSTPVFKPDLESHPIMVNTVQRGDEGHEGYQTTFLMAADQGGEYELVYFRRLDDEFNKVLKFYKTKVEEVMKEAAVLNKQMDALIAFRVKVDGSGKWSEGNIQLTRFASEVAASAAEIYSTTPSAARSRKSAHHMDAIEEDRSVRQGLSDDSTSGEDRIEAMNEKGKEKSPTIRRANRPAPIEILDRVKINNSLETPRSTLKGIIKVPEQPEMRYNNENLRKVEKQLKRAFTEFYNKLRLLRSYSFLNMLAFSKIMKKYDKITSRYASKSYLKMVDNSYLGTSEEVVKLMDRVEATFIKHFANANRRKGMNSLRPSERRERHRTSFSLGFLAGCTAALLVALLLIIRAHNVLDHKNKDQYMNNMYPLYTFFAFIIFHMIMYAFNIFYWRKYRVNYSFIFGFKQGTELGFRQVLLVSFAISVLALGAVLANLDMEMDPKTKDYKAKTELLPLGLVVLLVVVFICPLNVVYRSSRYFFLTCAFHCLLAPLYKVSLPDFFLADQLTSQVQAIRSLEFYICYYGWGDYKHRENSCKSSSVYNTFYFIVAAIPYWWRLLQCLRRFVEEKDAWQGLNGLKYFSTIVAVCARTAYTLNHSPAWNVIAWITSAFAAIFSTYWDLVLDWGLLQKNSKNRWLRDKLLVPHKSVYYVAIVFNILLRFVWMQTVLNFQVSFLHRQTLVAVVAFLEILRRGVWNFFRLENEHLNNVGKYRAFKSVPLPFNYEEEDE